MVREVRGRSRHRDLDVDPQMHEGAGDADRGAGCAEGRGGQGDAGGTDRSGGARLDPAHTSKRDAVSRSAGSVAASTRDAEEPRQLRSFRLQSEAARAYAPTSSYASIGGQAQIRLRSPYGLSMRPTAGHTLLART